MPLRRLVQHKGHTVGDLTFILHQFNNVMVPSKHNLEHVEAKIVGRAFRPKVRRTEGYIAEPRFGEGEEVHVLVLLGLIWAPENLFAQSRRVVPRGCS